jgi:hypothetical protein
MTSTAIEVESGTGPVGVSDVDAVPWFAVAAV